MEALYDFIGHLNSLVWSLPVLFAFVAVSIFVSVKLKWLQFTKFNYAMKQTFGKLLEKNENKGEGDVSAFAALTTAMSSTLGVGTLVGTTTAIVVGGAGAVFWMMFAALFALAVKYSELVLAVHYREKNDQGNWTGGPFYYIKHAFRNHEGLAKFLAAFFSVGAIMASFTLGNMIQGQSLASAINSGFPQVPLLGIGIVASIVVGLVILGGITRIAQVAEKTVPTMTVIMFIACIVAIFMNIQQIPHAFVSIFTNIFSGRAAVGGVAGAGLAAAIRIGITRGILSNEGGLGSAPIAHATAKVDHPVKQGFWGIVEVFVDTHVMCLVVALVVLSATNPDGSYVMDNILENGTLINGAPLLMEAMRQSLPMGNIIAPPIVATVITLFALTTMFGFSFYGLKGMEYLFGTKSQIFFRIVFIPFVLIGTLVRVGLAFNLSNIFMLVMVVPNLIALVASMDVVNALTQNYFTGAKYVSWYEVTQGKEDVIGEAVAKEKGLVSGAAEKI